MAHHYRNYSPDQIYLLPADPREWLPVDCLAYQVRDIVSEFDLTLIHAAYSSDGRGAPAFSPQMMLSILLYAQYKGVSSSRGIKRLCIEDIGARYLAGGIVVDHRSISLFRIRHGNAIRQLFLQSVRLCRGAGMVPLKVVAIDGTKIAGAGSKESSKTYEHIVDEEARLYAEIGAMLQAGLDIDVAEDNEFGEQNDGFSLPEHLKSHQDRVAALRKAREELETRAKERASARKEEWDKTAPKDRPHRRNPDPANTVPDADDRYNFTDPESRLMKGRRQFVQGYNAQASVDAAHQVIVACGVTNDCTDYAQLVPMAEQIVTNLGEKPEQVLADAGYFDHKNISDLEATGFSVIVPPDRKWKQNTTLSDALPENEHKELTVKERMRHKVNTEQGRADYAIRMKTVEPVFAQTKGSPGHLLFTRFLRRGRQRVDEDWCFQCLGHNLRKLIRFRRRESESGEPKNDNTTANRVSKRLNQPPKFTNLMLQCL